MFSPSILLGVLATLTASVSALAIPAGPFESSTQDIETRATAATCAFHCGTVCYWQDDIDAALAKGYSLKKSGQTLGSGSYPHQYNDYEGFTFPNAAPWYEFPILSSYAVYTGGSPGADRVIFNAQGLFDTLLTHTGASGNNFVACKKG